MFSAQPTAAMETQAPTSLQSVDVIWREDRYQRERKETADKRGKEREHSHHNVTQQNDEQLISNLVQAARIRPEKAGGLGVQPRQPDGFLQAEEKIEWRCILEFLYTHMRTHTHTTCRTLCVAFENAEWMSPADYIADSHFTHVHKYTHTLHIKTLPQKNNTACTTHHTYSHTCLALCFALENAECTSMSHWSSWRDRTWRCSLYCVRAFEWLCLCK